VNDNPSPSGQSDPTTTTSTTSSGSKRKAKRALSAAEFEPKRRKFRNLINGRVGRCLNAIRVVANVAKLEVSKDVLADDDVEAILQAIEAEVAQCRRRLTSAATGHQLDVEFDVDASRAATDQGRTPA
jgi:hypothetical protein